MPRDESAFAALLDVFECSWQNRWPSLSGASSAPTQASHPLADEIDALRAGGTGCLAYLTQHEARWVTIAPSAEALQAAIEALRAWVFPTFGLEERIVTPGSVARSGELSSRLLALSPAGYFCWRTPLGGLARVVETLAMMRRLESARPRHALQQVPSLYELRRQFETALVAGDYPSADGIVRAIDRHGLDTATNTRFMRIRLWDYFCEHRFVADETFVRDTVRLRMPHAVRVSLLRLLHAHWLSPHESGDDLTPAARAYEVWVHPVAAGLLDRVSPTDGLPARRCLGYRAWLLKDVAEARLALGVANDPPLAALLAPIIATPEATPPVAKEFVAADGRVDLRTLREALSQVLRDDMSVEATDHTRLAELMRQYLREHPEIEPNALVAQAVPETSRAMFDVPLDWSGFIAVWRGGGVEVAQKFLDSPRRPSAAVLPGSSIGALLDIVEDALTTPQVGAAVDIAQVTLLRVLDDLRLDPQFPRRDHAGAYNRLFEIWLHYAGGSARREDGALALLLADALLQLDPLRGSGVVAGIANWWKQRRSLSLLPFVLDALSLVSHYGNDSSEAAALWAEAANFVHLNPSSITPSELRAWRTVGERFGITDETLASYFAASVGTIGSQVDPLARESLAKVAIVTRRARQAEEAARQIRSRSRADVIVVTEDDVGPRTHSATTANVILVVWSTISHAVYRAFDAVRDRVVYVQGTGAESIVMALERTLQD